MRVLITTDTIGGVWTFTHEMTAGLLERGCPVTLVSFGRLPSVAQREQCDLLSNCYQGRFRYVPSEIPLEWMENNGTAFQAGSELLRAEMEKFSPDILHSNQFCYGALDAEIPRVVTAHSDVMSWARACRGGDLPQSAWLQNYVETVQRGLLAADAVSAPTRWMMSELAKSFRLPGATAVVMNGRDIASRFSRAREVRAVTAGRLWDEAKGIAMLKDVESPMPIVVAGETRPAGPEEGNQLGSARLIGQLSEPEMIDLLEHSSVYICLSRYEPFGLAPLEAGLCGCAVIARNIPSLLEVWGSAALYFEDAPALSALLERLNSNPQLLVDARENSFRQARRFTRDRMVEQYLSLYRRVLVYSESAQNAA